MSSFRQALRRVSRKHLGTQLATGLATLLLVFITLLLAQTTLDRILDFPRSVRTALLIIDAIVIAAISHRVIEKPIRRRWRPGDSALAIQRRWPSLGSRIISAHQFTTRPSTDSNGSPLLIDALIEEATHAVTTLPLGQITPAAPALRRIGTALLLATIATTLAITQGTTATILIRRAFLSNIALPTATTIVSETQDIRAAANTDITLAATATGVIPAQGRLDITLANGEHRTLLIQPTHDTPARFAHIFQNIQQPFSYSFHLGDGHGPEYSVTPLPAPLLTTTTFTQTYPDYTQRPPLEQPGGALTLFPGSRVQVKARASIPLASGSQLRIHHSTTTENTSEPLSIDAADPRNAHTTFTVPAKTLTALSLPLVSTDGIPSADDTLYPVQLETDAPPLIRIEIPTTTSLTLISTARLSIRASLEDDFAIASAHLLYQLPDQPPVRIPLELTPPNTARATATIEFSPATQTPPIPEGATLTWWIEATDNNTATGPGLATSERRQITLVTFAQKQEEMLRRLEETSRRLEETANRQTDLRETLGEAIRQTQPTAKP